MESKKIYSYLGYIGIVCCVSLVCGLVIVHYSWTDRTSTQARPSLPDDVERVMEGYTFREYADGVGIEISGNRVVYRGKKVMGLRSNLIKTTYFEDIRGSLTSINGKTTFSATDADWDVSSGSPLFLRSNVVITVNGTQLSHVKHARINFKEGLLAVSGDRNELYHFK